jgi:hypothetical protein
MRSTLRLVVVTALACGLVAAASAEQPAFDPAVARRITADQVRQRRDAGEKPLVLDTRGTPADAVIAGGQHVPNDKVASWAKDKPRDAFIVTYCT